MTDVSVRRVQPSDLDALLELCREHAAYERSGAPLATAGALSVALFSSVPRLLAWVALIASEITAYATASPEFSTWNAREYLHLDCLYVRCAKRGTGAGSALLRTVIEHARSHALEQVQWQTPQWNTGACRFYRRLPVAEYQKIRFILNVAVPGATTLPAQEAP